MRAGVSCAVGKRKLALFCQGELVLGKLTRCRARRQDTTGDVSLKIPHIYHMLFGSIVLDSSGLDGPGGSRRVT